jgi:hypothetical protein
MVLENHGGAEDAAQIYRPIGAREQSRARFPGTAGTARGAQSNMKTRPYMKRRLLADFAGVIGNVLHESSASGGRRRR